VEVSIPVEEWEIGLRLLPLIADDEQTGIGQVRVRSVGGVREWSATDSYRLALVRVPAQGPDFEVGLSPAALRYLRTTVGDGDEATLHLFEVNGRPRCAIAGPGGSVEYTDLQHGYPDIEPRIPLADDIGATAVVNASQFHQAVSAAMTTRELDENGSPVDGHFKMGVTDTKFWLYAHSPAVGGAEYVVAADVEGDSVWVQLNPRYLLSLIELFEPGDDIVVKLPRFNSVPVVLQSDRVLALLMVIKSEWTLVRERVESLLEQVCGHLAVRRDDDGDYPLRRTGTPVYGRLLYETDPILLQVFAIVLSGIDASPELYEELNALNAGSTFSRLFHYEGQVLAEVDLVAGTIDEDELRTAIGRIREVAETIMPTLSAVLGGNLVEDPVESRMRMYRTAIIEAELLPDRPAELNGPDAVEDWPFPGSVFVLTGWNPQGVPLGDRSHESINLAIAEDIIRSGGRFVHGTGRSPDGEHREPSLIAWGLSRAEAVAMGRKANQDAIFEVDAAEVRVVSCIGDRVDRWPRRG